MRRQAPYALALLVVVAALATAGGSITGYGLSPLDIASGASTEWSVVHKFGRNVGVSTSYVPVSIGGVYQTPQPASATTLRIKAGGDANDTAAGTGARSIHLIGLDETGAEVSETVVTAGASASSATTTTFIRLYRVHVEDSGTYASSAAGSHSAAITIENGSGGTDWATIDATAFPLSQSEIGAYTVPVGYEAYIQSINVVVDASKTTRIILFKRAGVTDASAPYEAMRVVLNLFSEGGSERLMPLTPWGPFAAGTDIGFMAKIDTGTAEVNVDFEILLRVAP